MTTEQVLWLVNNWQAIVGVLIVLMVVAFGLATVAIVWALVG